MVTWGHERILKEPQATVIAALLPFFTTTKWKSVARWQSNLVGKEVKSEEECRAVLKREEWSAKC